MKRCVLFPFLLLPLLTQAQSPTWADDVACIIYSHCTSCHHPGGIGGEHLNLMSYTEAVNHRDDIAGYTSYRVMPPWPPDQSYRRMAHERTLTQDEIDIIAAWAAADGPQGNMANAPAPPVYADDVVLTTPDLSGVMDEYVIPPSTSDLYRCFVLPIDVPVDAFIKRMEVIPGNREVVHHVLVFQDTTGEAVSLDNADPEAGYTSFGGIGVDGAPLVGIWVPGSEVLNTPDGMGIQLFAGADIVIQVHYPAGSDFQSDSTRVSIELAPAGFTRPIGIVPALEHTVTLTNGPLIIPPNEVRTFHNQYTITFPATITAIGPHAHLICTSMRSWAITPQNDSIPLIDIPHWDFHWQGMYEFRNPVYLPLGTTLHGEATYDNTTANEANPNHDDPQWVWLGEATTNEMMLFYFAYTFGFPSDTLITVDDSEHGDHHLDCTTDFNIGLPEMSVSSFRLWPDPAADHINLSGPATPGTLRLLDAQGRELTRTNVRTTPATIAVGHLARGAVIAEWRQADGRVLHRQPIVLR